MKEHSFEKIDVCTSLTEIPQILSYVQSKLIPCNQLNCKSIFHESRIYDSFAAAVPEDIPNLSNRRQFPYDRKYENTGLDNEISEHGYFLAKGQILFHGGNLSKLGEEPTSRPLSTSLCLAQTKNHANKSSPSPCGSVSPSVTSTESVPEVWVLRVSNERDIKGYIYGENIKPEQDITNIRVPPEEFEMIIWSGVKIEPVADSALVGNYLVTIADIRSIQS